MLIDRFNRQVTYLRASVTDRCNFRCTYCMAEKMVFLPRKQVLSLEELYDTISAFVTLGVSKVRLTGGEPLVRRNVLTLIERLGRLDNLQQLAITTNASLLAQYAADLRRAGVTKLNISIDSLNADTFTALTRIGQLDQVLKGIDAAVAVGFPSIRLNVVILKGTNDHEVIDLVNFARDRSIDIAFIEEMPLGDIGERSRQQSYFSSDQVIQEVGTHYALSPLDISTGGPAKYYAMNDSSSHLGVISPHSHNFCSSCNRVRLTSEGRLLLCLGNEHSIDLRHVLRSDNYTQEALHQTIINSMMIKPERHHFDLSQEPQILRFMNTTGG